jgi:hypothetical protein
LRAEFAGERLKIVVGLSFGFCALNWKIAAAFGSGNF